MRFASLRWAVLSLVIAGCGPELALDSPDLPTTELATASRESALYYLQGWRWPMRDIPVCWESAGFNTEKLWVKETLRGQRSWAKAGNINFVGWGNCPPATTGSPPNWIGIRIIPGTKNRNIGQIGTFDGTLTMELDFGATPQNTWSRCIAHTLNREQCIRSTALHEFGHALSYSHEQNRTDTPASCTAPTDLFPGDTVYGAWDPYSIMNYCADARDLSAMDRRGTDRAYGQAYGDSRRLRDFNSDGRADLLCHDNATGQRWQSLAPPSGKYAGTTFQLNASWCAHDTARLFKGDFNGDGRTDALCHDTVTGTTWVDYADYFSGTLGTTDYQIDNGWCAHEFARLFVGDFNGDGRDDLLCRDALNGDRFVDYADNQGRFGLTDFVRKDGWCDGKYGRLYVGDFNVDGREDLLCHDTGNGQNYIDFADAQGRFSGTQYQFGIFCDRATADFYVGDFNGDLRDDVLCHDSASGEIWIDYNQPGWLFAGVDWYRNGFWCNDPAERLYIGKADNNNSEDLICHNVRTGQQRVDLASESGQFNGVNHSTSLGWCGHSSGEVH